jgi:hypothetical protein
LQNKWYRRLRGYWRFLILPVATWFAVSLVSRIPKGCAGEFLKELNAATVQLLGFTGIILALAFASYYSSLTQMNETSKGYLELSQKPELSDSPDLPQETRKLRQQMQVELVQQQMSLSLMIQAMDSAYRRSFKIIAFAASMFAILVIIGLLHLDICSCDIINEFFFFCECFLLVFGIEMLIYGLYVIVGATEVELPKHKSST